MTKQWNIVTSSLISGRHISSILYYKHFNNPIIKICSYMNKVKPFFQVEIGVSDKSADMNKRQDKKFFFVMNLKPTKF